MLMDAVLSLKDHLPERCLLVSTVFAPDSHIAETMVFRADDQGRILGGMPLFERQYDSNSSVDDVKAAHQEIVNRAKAGKWSA